MRKVFNILLAVMMVVVLAFSLTACKTPDEGGNDDKGLLIKKIGEIYTIYDFVDDGSFNGVLDIGLILANKELDNVTIKKGAFDGVDSISKLIVSDRVTEIEEGAFRKMQNLVELELPFIGKNAMADARFDQTDWQVNKSVGKERTIAHLFGTETYDGGAEISTAYGKVYVPATLTTMTINATSKVAYESGDKVGYAIPYEAFQGATNLTKINLTGANLFEIGEKAFGDCTHLTSITIPATVKTIHKDAFLGCTGIVKVNSADAMTVNFGNITAEIKDGAFNFSRENAKYKVVNAGTYASALETIFGTTEFEVK